MSLTTPVIRDADSVFPGEDWFFYWKTSASLWESKLRSMDKGRVVFVPINWSFHSETGDHYDFAQNKPETDLAKLVSVAKDCDKTIVFLFPLSPFPFLPNGGVPIFLARTPSTGSEGKIRSVIDHGGSIHKMYSFFDTRIYHGFSKFTDAFGHYISSAGIEADVWGIECGAVSDIGFDSFFNDTSHVYEEGFSKFLASKQEERLSNDKVITTNEEHFYKVEFDEMIRALYLERASMSLAAYWEGTFKVSFIGADKTDFFGRIYGQDSTTKYSHDILESLSLDTIPSSILLPSRLTQNVLGKMFKQLVSCSYVENLMNEQFYYEEGSSLFKMKRYFEVYDLTRDVDPDALGWADLGLWDYLQTNYSWCYSDRGENYYEFDEGQDNSQFLFFHGITIDDVLFRNILKTFMTGGQIVLNRSGLDDALLRRLEAFFIENSLNVEKVNFHTTLHNVLLGDGRLVLFEGDKLADLDESKVNDFWTKLISTFGIHHLEIPHQEGLEVIWSWRSSDHKELNYEEVRRVSFFNPSSYKKKVSFKVPDKLKLLKVVDEHQVSFKHTPSDISLELLPEGSISFDFGVLP